MKGLKVQDLVSIGIYATVYFFVVGLATFLLRFTVPTFNTILIPSVSALMAGTVYLMICQKVPKFGAITLVGSVMGIFFLLFGYFPLAFIPSVVFPFLADIIQTKTKWTEEIKQRISYTLFSFGLIGPILPLWFMKEEYISALQSKGKPTSYIDSVFAPITTVTLYVSMGLIVVMSLIGLSIGKQIFKKHFSKEEASR